MQTIFSFNYTIANCDIVQNMNHFTITKGYVSGKKIIFNKYLTILLLKDHLFTRKTNISYTLICTSTSTHQGVSNARFWKNFAYALNGRSLSPNVVYYSVKYNELMLNYFDTVAFMKSESDMV